jgi:hypothetical protein
MTGFGANPTTTGQGTLSANQLPISSVAVPGHANGDLTALEGGPESTDSNSNKTAPASIYIKDGNDVTKGTQADTAWGGSGSGSEIAILKKLVALLSAALPVSGTITANAGTNLNTSLLALETGGNLASAKTDLDTLVSVLGAQSDTTWSGSGSGSEIAILKKIVAELAATLIVSGTVTANAGTGTMTVGQATGTNLHTVVDSGTVTANAGTNMSTALLALETGGNLATLVTNTNKIPAGSVSGTLQLSQASAANGSTLNVLGMASATFTVTMAAFSGSVVFEGSGDGTTFQSISCNQQGTSFFSTLTNGATTTSTVLYTCSVASLQLIRAHVASATAGSVTVTAEAVPIPWMYSASTMSATQGTSPWVSSLVDGVGGVNLVGIDSSNRLKTVVSSALPAGANTLGNVGIVAGSAVMGSATIQAASGTALSADQSNTELRTSLYGKNSAAGDTPLLVDSTGRVVIGRSTVAAYSLASTTTTGSTQNSADITVGSYTEISIDINTTAQAGTSPTIQYFYERKGADNIYYVLWQSAVLTASANTLSTSIGAGMAYNQSLGLTGRLRWVVGGSATPTFTHSLNIYGK